MLSVSFYHHMKIYDVVEVFVDLTLFYFYFANGKTEFNKIIQ